VSQPLNDPDTTTLIRSCTLSGELTSGLVAETTVENPKTQNALAVAKLASEPSCVSPGTATSDKVQLLTGGPEENDENVRAVSLLKGMQEFFDVQENCDEQFVFAYFNETVTGAYIGRGLGKGTIKSSLHGLTEKYAQGSFPSRVVAEVCGNNGTDPGHVFGVTIENSRNLASVQRSAWEWSKGNCLSKQGLTVEGDLPSATVLKVSLGGNDTFTGNSTHTRRHSRSPFTFKHALGSGHLHHGHNIHIEKRAACTAVTVADGDTCPSLVKKCGTTSPLFVKYNPKSSLCSTLKKGDLLCCTAGDLPTSSPTSPKPDASGTCATHLIASGDTCSALATRYGVTVENIEKWNKGKTWAWTVCAEMLVGYNMCVSDGFAPMPPPQQGVST
jgi:LysM repeat protein